MHFIFKISLNKRKNIKFRGNHGRLFLAACRKTERMIIGYILPINNIFPITSVVIAHCKKRIKV